MYLQSKLKKKLFHISGVSSVSIIFFKATKVRVFVKILIIYFCGRINQAEISKYEAQTTLDEGTNLVFDILL